MKRTIRLPHRTEGNKELECDQSLILVGANGSGKTRLGAWIELSSGEKNVHRISAQKSLTMPTTATPISIDEAEKGLYFGETTIRAQDGFQYKSGSRWGGNPATAQLNDFQRLVILLFSDQVEQSTKYLASSKETTEKVSPPITKLDKVKTIWEKILPHRILSISGLKIQTTIANRKEVTYESSEMSDGERVIFYLIAQCISAPKDSIIIIDEPELHLHKSIQIPLWSELQSSREDCLFIYLTHDIDFTISQNISKKVWLKDYDGSTWDWEEILANQDIPQNLLVEVLGSRKNVVFVEGDYSSLDYELYKIILDNFLVIPVGSCIQVIQNTKSFKQNPQFHHLKVCGIVDRDRRTDKEIDSLFESDVFTLNVAEVENLFCTREVLEYLSEKLARNPTEDFASISSAVFSFLSSELENQISLRTTGEIKFLLNLFDEKSKGLDEINANLRTLFEQIDIRSLYENYYTVFQQIISNRDYESLLKFYNRKSLASRVGAHFGFKGKELPQQILRFLKNASREEIKSRINDYFGNFPLDSIH